MADEDNKPAEAAAEEKSGGGMMGKLMIGGFMGLVIVAETAVAYLLIPSADDIAARAEERRMQKEQEEQQGENEAEKLVEVDLGSHNIAKISGQNVSHRVDFHLYGTVLEEKKADFEMLFEKTQHRFRHQVLIEIRNAEASELNEAGLGLIKRRILEKSNALFGEPYLQGIIFSDYSHLEQ